MGFFNDPGEPNYPKKGGMVKKIINRNIPNISFFILLNIVFTLYLLAGSTKALGEESQIKDVGVYSHKLYENRDEARVICGDFRVIAFSDYRVGVEIAPSHKKYQEIIRQYFEIMDLKNGHKKMVVFSYPYGKENIDSNEKFIKQEDSYVGDHAYDWACLKGKDGYFLAIEYANGGNCYNCQWVEIINKKGEVIDTSEDDPAHFKKTLLELGLPQISPFEANFKNKIKFRQFWLDNKEKIEDGK
jgi:hypothetical protein